VVVAPPRALGILREHLADDVRSVMKAEFSRDLVRLPTPKVEAFLQAEGELR
jgi:protein required for attachment to host cells